MYDGVSVQGDVAKSFPRRVFALLLRRYGVKEGGHEHQRLRHRGVVVRNRGRDDENLDAIVSSARGVLRVARPTTKKKKKKKTRRRRHAAIMERRLTMHGRSDT